MEKDYLYFWSDFELHVKNLRFKLGSYNFNSIIGISKGGLPLAVTLSNQLNLPLKVVEAKSYINKKQQSLIIEPFNIYLLKDPILLVDDIADTGDTLIAVKKKIEEQNKKVQTLTLIYKPHSKIIPDFYAIKIENNVWVNFPWE